VRCGSDRSEKFALKCLLEVKSCVYPNPLRSRIKEALKRQDSRAKVSFIVVDETTEQIGDSFPVTEYQVLNRSKRDPISKGFCKGGYMRSARLFRVDVDCNRKVRLTAMDGRTSKTADRLIFVISRRDINAAVKSQIRETSISR
jgi:hypothetical protein